MVTIVVGMNTAIPDTRTDLITIETTVKKIVNEALGHYHELTTAALAELLRRMEATDLDVDVTKDYIMAMSSDLEFLKEVANDFKAASRSTVDAKTLHVRRLAQLARKTTW